MLALLVLVSLWFTDASFNMHNGLIDSRWKIVERANMTPSVLCQVCHRLGDAFEDSVTLSSASLSTEKLEMHGYV